MVLDFPNDLEQKKLGKQRPASCTDSCTSSPKTDRSDCPSASCDIAFSAATPAALNPAAFDANLSAVVRAWPDLPGHIVAAIMALVGTAGVSGKCQQDAAGDSTGRRAVK
jgi:hypothetical protein